MGKRGGPIERIERFLGGGGFPVFALSLILLYEVLLLVLLLTPGAESGLGAFADDFRIWCFGFDPATGRVDWGYAMGMTCPPLMIGVVFALLWWEPLREALSRPGALVGPVAAAVLAVGGAAGAFAALGTDSDRGELPFPAEAIRTAHRAPELQLVNQAEEPIDLAGLRGHVVMLTAVYASCPHTCPLILAQAKRAIGQLDAEEQADLRVVAVTMDPSNDSPAVLSDLADRHGMGTPLYNLVTGERAEVERVLDEMGITRRRDAESGVIDHANLFLLLDREGRVAYRLTLGDHQERWLVSALRVLLREPPDVG